MRLASVGCHYCFCVMRHFQNQRHPKDPQDPRLAQNSSGWSDCHVRFSEFNVGLIRQTPEPWVNTRGALVCIAESAPQESSAI